MRFWFRIYFVGTDLYVERVQGQHVSAWVQTSLGQKI